MKMKVIRFLVDFKIRRLTGYEIPWKVIFLSGVIGSDD